MERILGQAQALGTIDAALDSGKVHHAWIFHGPPGVGRFTTAIELAKTLLDPDATRDLTGSLRADSAGRVAQLVDRDSHPDLHIIRKELALYSVDPTTRNKKLTNIPVNVIREHMIGGFVGEKFIDAAAFGTPRMGHAKVFIIEEAELLRQESQNALLKTLEEPPARTYIILITTRIDQLLPTVRSRCQPVAFTPLDEEAMNQWLERSNLALDDARREWILRFADGSPGMALMAINENLEEWHREVTPLLRETDQGRFPHRLGDTFAGFVDAFAESFVGEHENASKDVAKKSGAERVFMLMASHARQRLCEATTSGGNPDLWLARIGIIRDAERAITANVNLKLVFENLAVQWADRAVSIRHA